MLNQYHNKKIAILGLGLENESLIVWLTKQSIKISLTIYDRRNSDQLADKQEKINNLATSSVSIDWRLGESSKEDLVGFDELWRSPGWPIFCSQLQQALKLGSRLNSPMNLFFQWSPTKQIIGVTGSKGKGTVSSLIYNILQKAEYSVFLGGNIGVAPFSFFDLLTEESWVILELSSFQLEDIQYSPTIAVITNLYEEHLVAADPHNPNHHQNMTDYWLAKQKIFKYQTITDWLVINQRLKGFFKPTVKFFQSVCWFNQLTWPSQLIGQHNQENIAAAKAVADIVGINETITKQAVADFVGLEHRLELVGQRAGTSYYNDSFATNPVATIIALKSFKQPVILLAGGADKGNDFQELAQTIVKQSVKAVILFNGTASPRFKKDLLVAGYLEKNIYSANSMAIAMKQAQQLAQSGDVVLLSTACASFGLFNNYKERGELFKQLV